MRSIPAGRPPSVTDFWPCCAVYGVAIVAVLAAAFVQMAPPLVALIGLIIAGGGLLAVEGRGSAALTQRLGPPLRPRDWRRSAVKLLGLALTLAPVTMVAVIFFPTLVSDTVIFGAIWPLILIGIAISAPLIFAETDRRMADPEDSYFHLGRLLLGRLPGGKWRDIRAHLLAWTVKGFFLPLMISWYIKLIAIISERLQGGIPTGLGDILFALMVVLFLVDLLGAAIGYAMTFKGLGTHIRSVNPSVTGWVAALACYPPFYYLLSSIGDSVEDLAWIDNVVAHPGFVPLAVAIIALQASYSFSTICFGVRFSNLTHRGIVTGGLYRWSKHPAYLSKNLFWWLMTIPFIDLSLNGLWVIISLIAINTIYFVRAKTEELHLRSDPTYRTYEAWMAAHGLFAPLARWRASIVARGQDRSTRRGWTTVS